MDKITKNESFLVFRLCDGEFAVKVNNVLEVLEKQEITDVPQTPEFISGVVNFRGEILPVIDTAMKMGITKDKTEDKFVIIVLDLKVGNNSFVVGAKANNVIDVLEIGEDEIKPVPEMGSKYDTDYLIGMIKKDKNFIMLLDIAKVFTQKEIVEISSIESEN